jgi:hypothetical protein
MPSPKKVHAGGLELSRLTLASLAVWLAVTCLVASNRRSAGDAAAAGDFTIAAADAGEFTVASDTEPEATSANEVAVNLKTAPAIRTTALAAVAAAPTGGNRFAFPDDVGGQLLSTKLTPPAQFEVWPVPYVSEPRPWRTLKLDPLPREVSAVTRTMIRQDPFTATIASRAGLSLHPLDLPGLPAEIAISVPTPIQVFPLPRSYAPSADANAVPFLAVSNAPPKEKFDAAANPARIAAEIALLHARLLAASLPTSFIRLALPDPFVQIREVQLTTKLPDLDPPVFPAGQPSRPNFPVIEVPGEVEK